LYYLHRKAEAISWEKETQESDLKSHNEKMISSDVSLSKCKTEGIIWNPLLILYSEKSREIGVKHLFAPRANTF
jgi:hypothetical protein